MSSAPLSAGLHTPQPQPHPQPHPLLAQAMLQHQCGALHAAEPLDLHSPTRPEASMDDTPEKERSEVPEPAAVHLPGLRIEALPWGKARGLGQNGGWIAAYSATDGQELWLLKVYDVLYDGDIEEDKQDRFIEDMALAADGRLRVTDERGAVYLVNLADRTVAAG